MASFDDALTLKNKAWVRAFYYVLKTSLLPIFWKIQFNDNP